MRICKDKMTRIRVGVQKRMSSTNWSWLPIIRVIQTSCEWEGGGGFVDVGNKKE